MRDLLGMLRNKTKALLVGPTVSRLFELDFTFRRQS